MNLSTSTNICAFAPGGQKNPMPIGIEMCAEAGYKYLDLNFCEAMNPVSRLRDDDWERYIDEIGELGERLGVHYTQCHLPYYDLFAPNAKEKGAVLEPLIHRSLQGAAKLGVKWAVTHPSTLYSAAQDMRESKRANYEYYSPYVEEAARLGIGIALENDFEYRSAPYQRIYCASCYELIELVDSFASNTVGACYDFGHANLVGGFHRQNLNVIGKRLKAVHVQDNCGISDDHLMPFFGNTDWASAMAGLADIGYTGELTYEIQSFGRFLPNELKPDMLKLSLAVGRYLISLYEKALKEKTVEEKTL